MRVLRLIVLGSLLVTALVAVGTLIFGTFDETTGRILGTSAAVAAYSLLVMAGATGLAPGRRPLMRSAARLAMGLGGAAFVLLVALIWSGRARDAEWVAKAYFHATIPSVALSLVVLLERVPLPRPQEWIRSATDILLLLFALAADAAWVALETRSEGLNRGIGVLGVLAALGIVVLPVIAWQARREAQARHAGGAGAIHATCPRCGHAFDVTPEPTRAGGA